MKRSQCRHISKEQPVLVEHQASSAYIFLPFRPSESCVSVNTISRYLRASPYLSLQRVTNVTIDLLCHCYGDCSSMIALSFERFFKNVYSLKHNKYWYTVSSDMLITSNNFKLKCKKKST